MGSGGKGSNCISLIALGETGSGKSSLLNTLLRRRAFDIGASGDAVTKQAGWDESLTVDGVTLYGIDTPGLDDGSARNEDTIRGIAEFLKGWSHGLRGVMAVFNGREPRFWEGPQKIIRFMYHAFGGTPSVLDHMCVVFTKCFSGCSSPDKEKLTGEYRGRMFELLGVRSEEGLLPVFFVDAPRNPDGAGSETLREVKKLLDWAGKRQPLPIRFREVNPDYTVTEEEDRKELYSEMRGGCRWKVFLIRRRQKHTPYNGEPPSYTDLEESRLSVQDTKVEPEVEEKAACGDVFEGDVIYRKFVKRRREKTTSLSDPDEPPRYSEWEILREWKEVVGKVPVKERIIERTVEQAATTGPRQDKRQFITEEPYQTKETVMEEVPIYEYRYQYRSDRGFWNPSPRYGSTYSGTGTAEEAAKADRRAYDSVGSSHYPYHPVTNYMRKIGTKRVPVKRMVTKTRRIVHTID